MVKIFQNISNRDKEKILKLLEAHTLTFPKNYNILPIIGDGNMICIIESGQIQIIRNDYNGSRIIIEELKDESVFGSNISYIFNSDYEITTKDNTTITMFDYNRLSEGENIKYNYFVTFLKNILNIMTEKTRERNERIEILTKRSIRDKLLEYFRIESEKVGANVIYLPFTFTDLADYLAVDRSAMSRELKYLKEEGFITITGRKIKLNMLYIR